MDVVMAICVRIWARAVHMGRALATCLMECPLTDSRPEQHQIASSTSQSMRLATP
uniref:Uncharacterized protein n=1 Tax=Arundo donax TaxID=35708 RepID=A0A0A9AG73_ARUDO